MKRRIAGSVLIFEAIVIILAVPVAVNVAGALGGAAWTIGLVFAFAAILVSARIERPWGTAAGWVVQGLVIASAVIVPTMGLLGAMFAGLYYVALRLVAQAEVGAASPGRDNRGSAKDGEAT